MNANISKERQILEVTYTTLTRMSRTRTVALEYFV